MPSIDARASIGLIHLTAADLPRMLQFYQDVLGFRQGPMPERGAVFLSGSGHAPFALGLTAAPPGSRPGRRTAGLYHAAYLFPNRRALALMFVRLGPQRVAIAGTADHLVSEAIYLRDPEGNGIELYADRPRDQWQRHNDQMLMTTQALDLEGLIGLLGATPPAWTGIDPAVRLGHVHLRVTDLRRAERFYHEVLGFEITTREYPGALFLSAGGYHHHLGVNTWGGTGIGPLVPGAPGLRYVTVTFPDRPARDQVVRQADDQGIAVERDGIPEIPGAVTIRDDDSIPVVLTTAEEEARVAARTPYSTVEHGAP